MSKHDDEQNASGKKTGRYFQLIESIFHEHYAPGVTAVSFSRDEIDAHAEKLGLNRVKNLGDLIYTFRYRQPLPKSIRDLAPAGMEWLIFEEGPARYRFVAGKLPLITPNQVLSKVKVPDSTPGMIARYALNDEQALLAKIRYNRLLDVFSRVTCYSLQSHLRTTMMSGSQAEIDELYVGVDRGGAHYVFPVQAKGGRDKLSIVQTLQDLSICEKQFPTLICRPISAQFMADGTIALFELQRGQGEFFVEIRTEKHYRLLPNSEISSEDLELYAREANRAG